MRLTVRLSRIARSAATLATLALAGAVALAGCGPAPGSSGAPGGSSPNPDAQRVVTTTTIFADLVRNVGGSRVTVTSIIPPGVGPEDYEPKPDDARLLEDAQLVVSNGVGLDDFLDDLLASGGGEELPHLVLGDGIPVVTVEGEENPHFWLDPTLITGHYLPAIRTQLAELDPDGAATYDANAAAYTAEVEAMDAELLAQVAEIPEADRKLVTFHDAFPYFADHFGFELVGVILENVGQEPTAADLAALVDTVRAAGVKAVFSEAQFSPELTRTLADEAGVSKVVTTLYNDALGPAPADTYLGLMRWNVDQIVTALR